MLINNILSFVLSILSSDISEKTLSSLKTWSIDDLISKIVNGAINLGMRIFIAIVVFYIGKFIINKIDRIANTIMLKRNVDASLRSFLHSLLKITLLFILIVSVIGILGIETSSFVAIFASASVAIGLALSGTLQNFAGGVLILLIKPYKVGDFIEFNGYTGTVKEIQIFHTVINTIDNKCIIIPNGGLSTGTINNYSAETYRRVEWNIGISYGDDVDVAKNVILEILKKDIRVMTQTTQEEQESEEKSEIAIETEDTKTGSKFLDKLRSRKAKISEKAEEWKQKNTQPDTHVPINCTPTVVLKELADSSVVLMARAWTKTSTYWDVYFDTNEKIYKTLPQRGISFPFPQMDVHVTNTTNSGN